MNLVRVGNTVINLDRVTHFEYKPEVNMRKSNNGEYFVTSLEKRPDIITAPALYLYDGGEEYSFSLYAEEATALWTYLERASMNIVNYIK